MHKVWKLIAHNFRKSVIKKKFKHKANQGLKKKRSN